MEIRRRSRRQIRDWALAFGPQDMAASRGEAAAFLSLCLAALGVVALGDLLGRGHGSVAAFGFLPVMGAGWFLAPRMVVVVAAVAVGLRLLIVATGAIDPVTAFAQALTIPIFAFLSHAAAVGVLSSRREEDHARRLKAAGQRASELEKAKSEFLRLASHELRSPVAVLKGYISMLGTGDLGELPPAAAEVVPLLTDRVNAVNTLVEQMLESARLEDSRLQLRPRVHQLGTLLPPAVDSVRPLLGEGHRLRLEEPIPEVALLADGRRICTILNNLLENAIKYSPNGGEINVRAVYDRDTVRIEVKDQGVGIPKAGMGKLFTRFGRVASESTAHIPGTGLGLYLSREIARLHGGDLVAESEESKGSTFTLILPKHDRAPGHLRQLVEA